MRDAGSRLGMQGTGHMMHVIESFREPCPRIRNVIEFQGTMVPLKFSITGQ
jgi:hypothetical protein